jgi:glucoamylase
VLRYPPGSHLVDPAEAQPSASLYFGKPSLSATPLVWAHAELIKLACARAAGQPLEILPAVAARYAVPRTPSGHWRRWHPFPELQSGRALVVEDLAPFELSYRLDGGATQTRSSVPLSFGLHGVTLAGTELAGVATVIFRLGNDPSEQQVAITDEPQLTLRAHSDRAR